MIQAEQLLRKKGLDPSVLYVATVTDNDDPRKLGRIRARIVHMYDDIPDDKLPWAMQLYQHPDGAYLDAQDETVRSGYFDAPQKGASVFLQFPDGNPLFPICRGYAFDQKTVLPESQEDYPNRLVVRLRNGTWMIINKETNEVFINSSGDLNMTILGDVNQTIVGNHQLTVTDNKQDIPGYLLNLPGTILSQLVGKATKALPFLGLLRQTQSGSSHTTVAGDQTMTIKGSRKVVVEGDDTLEIRGKRVIQISRDRTMHVGTSDTVACGGNHRVTAARIDHN